MKFVVTKNAILECLQKVLSIVSSRSTIPILSNVLLRTEGERLWVFGTDLEVCVQTSLAAKVERHGATTLPVRHITSICKELPGQEIEIEVDDRNVATIKSGAVLFKIIGLGEENYPALPKLAGGESYVIEQSVYRYMLQMTAYAASLDETRHVLMGVWHRFAEKKLTMAATDGRRLALVERELSGGLDNEVDFILPNKTVAELLTTLQNKKEDLTIRFAGNLVAFEFGNILIISKLLEGCYPNFRQVIPASADERVSIGRESLLNAVRRVSLISRDRSNVVKLNFSPGNLEVVNESQDIGEARETLAINYQGREIRLGFNSEFLMEPLKSLQEDDVVLEISAALGPGIIRTDNSFLYVLMPVRS